MATYFIVFLLLSFFALADAFNVCRKQRMWMLLCCFVVLTLMAGLRYDSPDYDNYWRGFRDVERSGLDYSRLVDAKLFEYGYNLLVWIVTLLSGSPVTLFVVVAAAAVGLNLSSYRRYSEYFLVAVMLYFVHTFLLRETMQIRAGVAAGICLWSLRWVEERRPWRFAAAMAAAMSFHLASVAFAAVYYFCRRGWDRRVWVWLVAASLVIAYVMPLGRFLSHLPFGGIVGRISVYSWMIDQSTGVLTNPTIAKQRLFVAVGVGYWNTLSEKAPHFRLLFIPLVMSLCWLLVWNDFSIIAARIATFFSITEVLVVPSFLYLFTPRSRPVAVVVIVLFAFATLCLNTMPGSNVPEYINVLSVDQIHLRWK